MNSVNRYQRRKAQCGHQECWFIQACQSRESLKGGGRRHSQNGSLGQTTETVNFQSRFVVIPKSNWCFQAAGCCRNKVWKWSSQEDYAVRDESGSPCMKKDIKEARNSSQEVENWIRAGRLEGRRLMGSEINKVGKTNKCGEYVRKEVKMTPRFSHCMIRKVVLSLSKVIMELRKELRRKTV